MQDKQKLSVFLTELLALLDKHDARLTYTTDDDGLHAEVGDEISPGFFDRDDLRSKLRDLPSTNVQPRSSMTTQNEIKQAASTEGLDGGRCAVISKFERKLVHARRRLAEKKAEQDAAGGSSAHTYHGGWSKGYLEGKVAALEDVLNAYSMPSAASQPTARTEPRIHG